MIEFVKESKMVELTGKVRYHAQVKALRTMGIDHRIRPDGRPLVLESDIMINQATEKPKTANLNLSAI